MPVEKRITQKEVEIGGQKFIVKKMDARLASYVAFQLKAFMPKSLDVGEAVSIAQSGMNRKEFFALQNDCLSVCYHVMSAGETSVLAPDNTFVSDELTYDPKTVLLLTISSLAFNVADFFDVAFLKEFGTLLSTMMPSLVKMSPNLSTRQ